MSYRIAKLVSDYVSPGVYVNRLELGDSGLNGPVDLRFIGEPGWIENAHSVFFGVNGRDAYYPTNTGGLITTSDTGDLVFFDPSNENGRTLSQLYSGGGLWEDMGSYVRLIVADDVDFRAKNILHLASARAEFAAGMTIFDSAGGTKGYLGTTSYAFSAGADINMGSSWKLKNLAAGAANGDSIRYDEFHTHDIATTGVHGVGANTLEHTGHKGAASGYCELDADTRVPNNRYMLTTKGYLLVGKDATTCDTLAVGVTNGHVLTIDSAEVLGVKWAAQSGGGGVTNPMSTDLDADGHDITDLGQLNFRTSLAYAEINFDSNDDYLGYDCTNDRFEFKIANVARLTIDTEEIEAYENLNMHGYDITSVDDITMSGAGSIIDMNDGDIRGIDELRAYDGSGVRISNSGGTIKMEIGQTTDAFKVYNNVNMNLHDVENVGYVDGRNNGHLYIRADPSGDAYDLILHARGYDLLEIGYLDASNPTEVICHTNLIPGSNNSRNCGTSSLKWSDVWATNLHGAVSDLEMTDKVCPNCGKTFLKNDILIFKVIGFNKENDNILTIPIHFECT